MNESSDGTYPKFFTISGINNFYKINTKKISLIA